MTTTAQQPRIMYRVTVSIHDPDLAMSAIYYLYATGSLDASEQATEAAGREFGHPWRWSTEHIEAT